MCPLYSGSPTKSSPVVREWLREGTTDADVSILATHIVVNKVDLDGFEFEAKGAPSKPKDVLTRDEVVAVLNAARHENFDVACMIWLGFTTGMRFCELSSLVWDDINFDTGSIRIMRSQVNGNVGPTKTETQRTVTVIEPVLEMLKALPAWHEKEGIESEVPGLVFPSRLGGYRYPSMLLKPLARCAQKAGVQKNITPHTMRRTCNNLVRQSAGDIAARAMVGHATSEMTELYSDVTVAEKRQAQQKAFGDLSAVIPEVGAVLADDSADPCQGAFDS